jgi:hypothetical protein
LRTRFDHFLVRGVAAGLALAPHNFFAASPDLQNPLTLSWTTPSKNSSGSMPLGNGDIGLNVWVEEGGDLLLYIGKCDSWDENGRLLKLGRLRTECDNRSYPNLLVNYDDDGGGSVENVSGFLAVNEMLFQSHDGVLRFFPCWPPNLPARFGTLRAGGAFLVSGEFAGGMVKKAIIKSEKGRPCRVQNPWPGKALRVTDSATGGEIAATPDPNRADCFVFQTQAGHAYELRDLTRRP